MINYNKIARGLLDIHNAEKVHKDFHFRQYIFNYSPYISDLGMCQLANIKQTKWNDEIRDIEDSEDSNDSEFIFKQMNVIKLEKKNSKTGQMKINPKASKPHPQAIYISRLFKFQKFFQNPVNSSDLSSFQFSSANPISECLDVQLSELLELNEICQDDEHNIE
ncbi:unnamed protein product [Rhizophagus irregularis]|nr:unnamed protein product [Rhizophagus irregularis]